MTDGEDRTITVTANEEVRIQPDMAEVVCGVTTEGADPETCRRENGAAVAAAVEALKTLGVKENAIQTSRVNLSPRYEWNKEVRTLVGYQMSASLTVSSLPMDLVGKVLADVVRAGVTDVQSVSYQSSRYDEAYEQALEKAVKAARKKAEVIARAGGCALRGIAGVTEAVDDAEARCIDGSAKMLMACAPEEASPISPGEIQISAHVMVRYWIA